MASAGATVTSFLYPPRDQMDHPHVRAVEEGAGRIVLPVDEIVAQAEKMRQADTRRQSTALSLLRAAARLVQATLRQPEDTEEHLRRLRSVRQALTRLENILHEDI